MHSTKSFLCLAVFLLARREGVCSYPFGQSFLICFKYIMLTRSSKRPSSPQTHIESFTHRTRKLPSPSRKLSLDRIGRQHIQPFEKDIYRCLDKIGCNPMAQHRPSEQQIKQFRTQRYRQLKSHLTARRRRIVPFDFELDEIVLDCYDYKETHGRRSIWKKYRGDVDQLSFRVLLLKKGNKV